MNKKQKEISAFINMTRAAEARALSKISLERELTGKEFKRFKEVTK